MNTNSSFQPRNPDDIADYLRARSSDAAPVFIRGGGSKAAFGLPAGNGEMLDLGLISGISLYEPEELVLTARAGTPLAEIEAAVAARGQILAFEPPEFGAFFGDAARRATLGGVVASGWSGPRRIKAGAVRDHVLGVLAVGGDGQPFKSGGRVVKNVTGFDLPKLLTGSHGSLAVMTDITIKVLPAAEATHTLVVLGLDDAAAIRLLLELLGGPYEVSGATHLPATAAARSAVDTIARAGTAATLIRLEGFGPSVDERSRSLNVRIARDHQHIALDAEEGAALWREVRDVAALVQPAGIVWRLSLPATDAAATVAAIAAKLPVEAFYDWGGALVWLTLPDVAAAHAEAVRSLLPSGHATLMRAPPAIRAGTPIFHPQPPALTALSRRVKAAFDPQGVLGRPLDTGNS